MPDSLESKFERACCLVTFLASQGHDCEAEKLHKSGIELIDLAQFKYILPDEVLFEYQDPPFDAIYGDAPCQRLVFAFNDKRARKRSTKQLRETIKDRIDRFNSALAQFLARRGSLDDLKALSAACIPNESDQDLLKVGPDRKFDDRGDPFENICAGLQNILAEERFPARTAQYGPIPQGLASIIKAGGYERLYRHQSTALSHLIEHQDQHLVISTSTASGKSLIFHTLVQHELEQSASSTALFIYPTKALAHDQLRSFKEKGCGQAYTFDGDVEWEERDVVRRSARVLFVNPDILHTTLLPNWKHWAHFLCGLRYVVIDELHYYSGVFGANVGLVLRRLRRLCHQLGAEGCQYIGCSATLSDPADLMSSLTGLPASSILELTSEDDGSPSGAKQFVFCTPNFVTPEDPSSGRLHPIKEAAPMIIEMVKRDLRVIAFCRYRRECELLLRAIYESEPDLKDVVMGYRSGYNKEDRRRIENMMFHDNLRAIVATSALEVGIDIGSLDAAVIVGFPHSISSFRQQIGRVGRRQRDSLIVYVADGSAMNQVFARDLEKVVHSPIPRSPVPLHESIIRAHLQCAAYELPLEPDKDLAFFPAVRDLSIANLEETSDGLLVFPVKPDINIRKADGEREDTVVVDARSQKILERVEFERVGFTLYEGAIFIHQGKPFIVVHLDADLIYAKVQSTKVKWITRQRDYTDVDPVKGGVARTIDESGSFAVSAGGIKVTTVVFGYYKFNELNQIIDSVEVNIPPVISYRSGVWLNLPHHILGLLKSLEYHIPGAIHAAEHAIIAVLPLYTSMSPGDTGTECKAPEKEFAKKQTSRQRPARLIFYEKYGGSDGNGILRGTLDSFRKILERACEAIDTCPCELGCLACVCMGNCTEQNAVISKRGAQVILRSVLGKDLEGISAGPEPNMPQQNIVTVVSVESGSQEPVSLKTE